MADAAATANPQSGSDSAYSSSALDNPANLNFWEPGDEEETSQATPEAQEDGIDPNAEQEQADEVNASEAEELDASQDDVDDEDAGQAERQPSLNDDTEIQLGDQKLTLKELKAGYLKEADYRMKTHHLGNERRDLAALSGRVQSAVGKISEFLAAQVPPAPHFSLATTNPGQYVREQAAHEAAMAQLNSVLSGVDDVKAVGEHISDEDRKAHVLRESALLAEAIPEIRKDQQKFFNDAFATGRELGFTDEEMDGFDDHRYFKVMHYAMKGLASEKALVKARAKTQDVPPVAPAKRPVSAAQHSVRANKDAMRRLEKSGSIQDAMKIDFA